ncbi:MAG: transcriptional repressor NrdR [Planctomycetes bacterium]|nr:transcriptional repressor NrdR [Planctomycetota bacterium]
MRCPSCGSEKDRVVDSRSSSDGLAVRRRRECQGCNKRFTSYERIEETPRMVVKKDMRREPFNRAKVLDGIMTACQKRRISVERMESIVDEVEKRLREEFDQEVPSGFIGEIVIEHLRKLDSVAYVRFASVYQEFADVTEFLNELTRLVGKERKPDVQS